MKQKTKQIHNSTSHRPVYLWAGPGTIRMNRLKFLNAPVDVLTHMETHTDIGATRICQEAGCNCVYLTYDWGFPPEIEEEDWKSFTLAAKVYKKQKAIVFAYLQTSNCVYQGSFRAKNWYALNSRGEKIHYGVYPQRYMTCWQNAEWREHIESMVLGAITNGADGIFFDNPWYAAQPYPLGGSWLGSVGCYCPICREKYHKETGLALPENIDPKNPVHASYIRWRAQQATGTISMYIGYAKSLNPDILVSSNDFDAVMRPSYLIYGIDLQQMSRVKDFMMIEDYGLPRWTVNPRPRLANNALTIRTARCLSKNTHVSVDPYDQGIGFENVFSSRRFQQAIGEAAALGASNVIKATEFTVQGVHTLLSADQFLSERQAIGHYNNWLAANAHLWGPRANQAVIGLCYPGDALWQDWFHLAPLFLGAGQSLTVHGLPWKVVQPEEDMSNLQVLVGINSKETHAYNNLPSTALIIHIDQIPEWINNGHTREYFQWLKPPATRLIELGMSMYTSNKIFRSILDKMNVMRSFTGSPFFLLPPPKQQKAFMEKLPDSIYPRVTSKFPVLIETCEVNQQNQIHLVNYADEPQEIHLQTGQPVSGRLISPDTPDFEIHKKEDIKFRLDIYSILIY